MDGAFYNDLREPFISTDLAAVTLGATLKALYTPSAMPILGGQYWARPGKKMHIRAFGRMTTGATPGNLTVSLQYGTGADANGVTLAASAATAMVANATNLSWMVDLFCHCRTTGSVGTLFVTGKFTCNVALILSTAQPLMIPTSAPAVSGACDLTAALIPSLQVSRSGSTAETMQIHDMEVLALN